MTGFSFLDPTYTGLNRASLEVLPDNDVKIEGDVINLRSPHVPALRLGSRASKFTSQPIFRDLKNIGSSRFDDKGSVLMANIDAVLNLTGHVGGYIANATEDDNLQFYSLLLEDHNLEMHSYVQWRRPLSVSRVIIARVLVKPKLKTAQLDILLKTDVPAIISLKPCSGYRIVGLISHGGGDSLTGSLSVTLKDLVTFTLTSLAVLNPVQGKAFVVFPFRPSDKTSGTLTRQSILDYAVLLILLFKKVWCFRPYMCHNLVCMGFAEPRGEPAKGTTEERYLLALWDAMNLLPPLLKKTPTSSVDPEIAKVAELSEDEDEPPVEKTAIKLEVTHNFSRLFEGSDTTVLFPKLSRRINEILTTEENPDLLRDRVEVLGRWQLPDSIDSTPYPF